MGADIGRIAFPISRVTIVATVGKPVARESMRWWKGLVAGKEGINQETHCNQKDIVELVEVFADSQD